MASEWRINSWYLAHPAHGHFFIDTSVHGRCTATRVHMRHVEDVGTFDNVAAAMIACQTRIAERDQQMTETQREIDAAGAARESAA